MMYKYIITPLRILTTPEGTPDANLFSTRFSSVGSCPCVTQAGSLACSLAREKQQNKHKACQIEASKPPR